MVALIIGIAAGLGLLALLLWLSTKYPMVQFVCMLVLALTLTICCFIGPGDEETSSFDMWLVESLFMTGFLLFMSSDLCFDTEYYLDTKFDKALLSDEYHATTKLASQSTFWGTFGSCLLSAGVILGIIHLCCGDDVRLAMTIVGWIGVICTVLSVAIIAKFIYKYIQAKRRYEEDY